MLGQQLPKTVRHKWVTRRRVWHDDARAQSHRPAPPPGSRSLGTAMAD